MSFLLLLLAAVVAGALMGSVGGVCAGLARRCRGIAIRPGEHALERALDKGVNMARSPHPDREQSARLRASQGIPAPFAACAPPASPGRDQDPDASAARYPLKERLQRLERKIILDELQKTAHNRARAAKNLGISANTLWRNRTGAPHCPL